jgi:hypothetical protein
MNASFSVRPLQPVEEVAGRFVEVLDKELVDFLFEKILGIFST